MSSDLETFNYFVDDLLASNANLLKYELDILLMQNLFNSQNLEEFKDIEIIENSFVAWYILIMKYFYEKIWIPFFGGILSKFVFLIEGKQQKLREETSKSKFESK